MAKDFLKIRSGVSATPNTAPADPANGDFYYDSGSNQFKFYQNGAWITISGGSSPLTTKGDIYTYDTDNARLPVGTNGYVLTADSSTATGLKWAAITGANTALSNLASVAINTSLLPGADNTIDVGSASFRFANIHTVSQKVYGSTSGILTLQAADTTTSYTVKFPAAQGGASTFLKNDGSGNLTWGTVLSTNPNDIPETSFAGSNNQSSPANITGFAFANANVRAFDALVSVTVSASPSLYETIKIHGVQKGSEWHISQSVVGDSSSVNFTITTGGQIQYTSANYSGFSSLTIKFRAITTSV